MTSECCRSNLEEKKRKQIVQKDNNENGAPEWGIHYDEELVGTDLMQAMENHVEASKALTQALLERADLGFEENQN